MGRNYLFVCGKNRLRSPTAEHIFADIDGLSVLSAGTNSDADEPLTNELVDWADLIFVMERSHRSRVQRKHRAALKNKRVIVLGIPDTFEFMDPQLVELLEQKMTSWLPG